MIGCGYPERGHALERVSLAGGLIAVLLAAGVASVERPLVIPGAIALAAFGAIVVRGGLRGATLFLIGVVPWLVVFNDLLPPLTRTLASGVAALAVFMLSRSEFRLARTNVALRVGIALFVFPILVGVFRNPGHDQFTLALKLLVFPLMALAIGGGELTVGSQRLMAWVVIASGTAALATEIAIGKAGIGHIGTAYGSGEILGYAVPHDIALVSVCIAAGALSLPLATRWRVLAFSLAVASILLTGVRAGILAVVVMVLASLFQSGARLRTIVIFVIAVAVGFSTGADKVIHGRLQHSHKIGEFNSVSNYGSGRIGIYTVAFEGYASSGAVDSVMGTGLRSIPRFETAATGNAFEGHSDLIEAAVELGPLGLLGFVMIWFNLFRTAALRLPLIGLLVYGLVNGSLEYTAGVVLALVLGGTASRAVASQAKRGRAQPAEPPGEI